MPLSKQKKRAIDYILPFLIFISLGVIAILGFQLWTTLNPSNLKTEAFLYVAEGKSQILPWGIENWEPGISGSKILQGDSIKTSSRGKAILELYDKSIVRLGENTEIIIEEFVQDGDQYNAKIKLTNGKLWVKTSTKSNSSSQISIESENLLAISNTSTFAIESTPNQAIHLIKNPLQSQILITESDTKKVAEKIQLTNGKSIILTNSDITSYANNESPSVINNTPTDFTESDWYKWNTQEDQNPTDFSVDPIDRADLINIEQPATPDSSDTEETPEPVETTLKSPTITAPSTSPFETSDNEVSITGTAPTDAQKIIVVTSENGVQDEYQLRNFSPGDSTWRYTAATRFDNLKAGSNIFMVYAEYETGDRSDPTELNIIYTPADEEDSATPENSNS